MASSSLLAVPIAGVAEKFFDAAGILAGVTGWDYTADELRTTGERMEPAAEATGGGIHWIVDGDVDELPADAAAVGLAIAGDAVADSVETAEVLMSMWIMSPGSSRS